MALLILGIIDRYVFKQVLYNTIVVSSMVLILFVLLGLMLWLPSLVSKGYSEIDAILKVCFMSLWLFSRIYPAVISMGILIAFSIINQNHEFIVMQMAGASGLKLMRVILIPGFIFAIFGFVLAAFTGPKSHHISSTIQLNKLRKSVFWFKNEDKFFHVKTINGDSLSDIDIYQINKNGVRVWYHAKRGSIKNNLMLSHIFIRTFKGNKVIKTYKESLIWPFLYLQKVNYGILSQDCKGCVLSDISRVIRLKEKFNLNAKLCLFYFVNILASPMVCLLFVVIVVPFITHVGKLGSLNYKLIFSLGWCFFFYFVNEISTSLSVVLNFPVMLGVLLPVFLMIFFTGCMYLYLRYND